MSLLKLSQLRRVGRSLSKLVHVHYIFWVFFDGFPNLLLFSDLVCKHHNSKLNSSSNSSIFHNLLKSPRASSFESILTRIQSLPLSPRNSRAQHTGAAPLHCNRCRYKRGAAEFRSKSEGVIPASWQLQMLPFPRCTRGCPATQP